MKTQTNTDSTDHDSDPGVRASALHCLRGHWRPVSLSDLAAEIVEEAGSTESPEECRRTEIRLHHVALPMLDDVGLLEYDPETRIVSPPSRRERSLR